MTSTPTHRDTGEARPGRLGRRTRRWRVWLAVPLLALATAAPAAFAAPLPAPSAFTDLAGVPWAEPSVLLLTAQHVVHGVSPTSFAPDAPLTGEAAITFLSRILPGTLSAPPQQRPSGVDPWAVGAVEWAEGRNIIRHPDSFEATAPAPRAQVVAWVVRALGLGPATPPTFADAAAIPLQYADAVGTAQAQGLVQGNPDGDFQPSAPITRAQMAVILVRAERALARGHPGSPAIFDWSLVQGSASQQLATGTVRTGSDALPVGIVDTGSLKTQGGAVTVRYIVSKQAGAGMLTVRSGGATVRRPFAWVDASAPQNGTLWFFSGAAPEGYSFTPSPQQVLFQKAGGGGLPSTGSVASGTGGAGGVSERICTSPEGCPQGSSHERYQGPALPRTVLWALAAAGGPELVPGS